MTFKPHEALPLAAAHLPSNPIIVEAGSFDGRDTCRMASLWPDGLVHAFEPVPELFSRLDRAVAAVPNVRCYPLALSSSNGQAPFYIAEKLNKPGIACQAGSLRRPKGCLQNSRIQFPRTQMVKTVTIDAWAERYKVDRIDLLWLDLQGHELAVMQAAPRLLETISVIHTEVAFSERYEGQEQYEEVKAWLIQNRFYELAVDFTESSRPAFGNALFVKERELV